MAKKTAKKKAGGAKKAGKKYRGGGAGAWTFRDSHGPFETQRVAKGRVTPDPPSKRKSKG